MSVFSKCIKADLELVSADKSSAIAQSYLRACRSAQRCWSALPVFFSACLVPFLWPKLGCFDDAESRPS